MIVDESYFGCEVEILAYIKDIDSYLGKIDEDYVIYNYAGDDALGLSSIIIDEINKEELQCIDTFLK